MLKCWSTQADALSAKIHTFDLGRCKPSANVCPENVNFTCLQAAFHDGLHHSIPKDAEC